MNLWTRFLDDVRRSPGRAAALGVGVVVALYVWGPHLAKGFGDSGGAAASNAGGGAGSTPEGIRSAASERDAQRLRDEFIAVAREAQALRALARAPAPPEPGRDPFRPVQGFLPIAAAAETAPDAGDPVHELVREEETLARAVLVQGVMRFGSGRFAILDGEVVKEGAEFGSFRLVEVKPRGVLLRGRFGTYELGVGNSARPGESGGEEEPR